LRDLPTSKTERKRQARGEARIKSLLEAAEVVFARDGYHGATTNEISATAEVSPATLYQFFANKDAIANTLAIGYADELAKLHEKMDFQSFARMKLADMVSAVNDPLLNFHKTHPAFLTLLLDAPLSKETWAAKHAIMEKFMQRMANMFRLREPAMEPAEADWAAQISMILFKAFIPEINSSAGTRKRRLIADFKALLVGYLEGQLG
jgi:AcrR family transcriptional regulator